MSTYCPDNIREFFEFENEMVLILDEQSAWLHPSILTDSLKMDYPFQISLCTAAPFPQKKSEKGCLWGRGTTVHRLVSDLDGWSISSSSVKTANSKMPVASVFNDSEGLYRTTVCRCLVRGPHYSARQMRFWWRVRASFFFLRYATEIPWPRLRGKTTYRD